VVLARRDPHGALAVDVGGDLPAVLGLPESDGPGLTEWLAAGAAVPADALARLEVPVRAGLRMLPRGEGALDHPERADVLAAVLAGDPRAVVVDVGVVGRAGSSGPAAEVAAVLARAGTESLLVTRPCRLALRRAQRAAVRPSGVVLLAERGRSLGRWEVEDMVGAPVVAEVPFTTDIARAADSGGLAVKVPRDLERALSRVA
jgi:hypothetical protein